MEILEEGYLELMKDIAVHAELLFLGDDIGTFI
jgi:hypothetical protein